MTKINKLILGVFKPQEINSIDFVKEISKIKGIDSVNLKILNDFRGVEETRMEVVGTDVDINRIQKGLKKLKSSLSSIDGVLCGEPKL